VAGSRWWLGGGKRVFDLAVAGALAIITLPLTLACAGLVGSLDGLPVLFRQTRAGRFGRRFQILKFRTMRSGPGSLVTAAGDPRVTTLGRLLRRTKLDELPQLWNVLRGDMSLVGPRPEVPTYAERQAHAFRAIADLRPGMTDYASVIFADEETVLREHEGEPGYYEHRLLPRKLALARLYRRRASLRTDLALLGSTALLVLGKRLGASPFMGERFVARARSAT
jgi:lipopolysaccharide/colanic/teichoic acid biosynthesis glycosyltransferase